MSSVNPVNFKIPSGYEYKNVNINNFEGLNLSENPFEGSNAACQEVENLYINENGVLAVRPRLEHIDSSEFTVNGPIYRVYEIDSTYTGYIVGSIDKNVKPIIYDKNNSRWITAI
jgi:hypothetical protein